MEQNLDLETRPCVVWKPTLRPAPSRSFTFSVFGRECHLRLVCKRWSALEFELAIVHHESRSHSASIDVNVRVLCEVLIKGGVFPFAEQSGQTLSFPFEKAILGSYRPSPSMLKKNDEVSVKLVCIFHGGNSGYSTEDDSPLSLINLDSLSLDLTKLLKDNILPDLVLNCKDRSVSAHHLVLSARSKVFDKLKIENRQIDTTEYDAHIIELFLECLYSGKFSPDSYPIEDCLVLYKIATNFQVDDLKVVFRNWLISHGLCRGNCCQLLIIADQYNDNLFKLAIISYISNHRDILHGSEWLQFSGENPKLGVEVYQYYTKVVLRMRNRAAAEKRKQDVITMSNTKNRRQC